MAFLESLETELHDFALLAACVSGGAVAVAAARGAGAMAAAAAIAGGAGTGPLSAASTAAGLDGAAVAAFHAEAAPPHIFAALSGPQVQARLGVPAVAGIHWVGEDGVFAGGVFVLAPQVSQAAEAAVAALGRRMAAQLRLREAVLRHREPLSATDGLTGLLNRHAFDAMLVTEWQRARRAQAPVALLLFELDGYGTLVAARGREAGNEAVRLVAGCLRRCVSRAGDAVGRFSQDQFAVLLAEVSPGRSGAAAVAERCRAAVERLGLANGAGGILTVSGGAVTLAPDAAEPARLLQRADSALYMAKDRGGNRICAFAARQHEIRQEKEESGAF